jgi:endoglucanase
VRKWLSLCATVAALPLALSMGAGAQSATGATSTNPLAGVKWGIYGGQLDGLYPAWQGARGGSRRLLAKEALQPSVHWLGAWDSDQTAGAAAHAIIDDSGGPDKLSEIAVFRLQPWEGGACRHVVTASDGRSYKRWISDFAKGVSDARMLIILQPDLPFALCAPGRGVASLRLVAYAARVLSALPRTTVYIDAGAADYASVPDTVWLLKQAGVRYARGFALNTTHSDGMGQELEFGAKLARWLGASHIPGRRFVINTAQNAKPFRQYYYQHQGLNPPVCASKYSRMCLTLGIPPTTDVANRRWGLSAYHRSIARNQCDAYVWTSRPWLLHGAGAFDVRIALQLARTTPY